MRGCGPDRIIDYRLDGFVEDLAHIPNLVSHSGGGILADLHIVQC
jgi:hypothetical protein